MRTLEERKKDYDIAVNFGYLNCIENIKGMLEEFPETISKSQIINMLIYHDRWKRTYHEKVMECDDCYIEISRLQKILEKHNTDE